jgi:hypothetical protein
MMIGLVNPNQSLAAPTFQMPFSCGQTWTGQTRTHHNPKKSIDFSRKNAYGDPVVASASGKIKKIGNLGNKSYGKYVYIDHGNGWETRYAHLSSITVKKGQRVEVGDQIGNVGSTGNSTGPHLHYEQKHNGVVQPIYFGSTKVFYYGTKQYKSKNKCANVHYNGTIKTKKGKLPVFSKPKHTAKVIGYAANKTKVKIYCQVRGSKIKGPFGTSTLWDQIGKNKYVPDSFVYTGSDEQIAPTCK